jgi:hypothetical protein
MNAADRLAFRSRTDDFSHQISADNDKRFWFRVERHVDQDVITDFFLGSVPEEQASSVLLACYDHLAITPQLKVVFKDILPGQESEIATGRLTSEIDWAQHHFAVCGKRFLRRLGARSVEDSLRQSGGKVDLVLHADRLG